MPEELQQIIPAPLSPIIQETFAAISSTREFYQEVKIRNDRKIYCAWYHTTAQKHRQELEQMRGEINILGWFRFKRR